MSNFDRARRILNELAACQPAVFKEDGHPSTLYLSTDTFGTVVAHVLAMRAENERLEEEVARLNKNLQKAVMKP